MHFIVENVRVVPGQHIHLMRKLERKDKMQDDFMCGAYAVWKEPSCWHLTCCVVAPSAVLFYCTGRVRGFIFCRGI